jgi:hypothetical protein
MAHPLLAPVRHMTETVEEEWAKEREKENPIQNDRDRQGQIQMKRFTAPARNVRKDAKPSKEEDHARRKAARAQDNPTKAKVSLL